MTLRDISFWIHSARTDSKINQLCAQHGSPKKAFDHLYKQHSDPFHSGRTRYRYQSLKYERLVSFLPDRRYRNVLDVGCGLGPFTRELAPYADHVLGVDISQSAVEQGRRMSKSLPNLEYAQCDVQEIARLGRTFDLITVLDVLYYISPLSSERLKSIIHQLEGLLSVGGLLLLVNHHFFTVDAASRQTHRIHNAFGASAGLHRVREHKRAFFLASLFAKT
jgi:2-polyprenyl-3-methyl-5-hydroxy-6-metoxy-1,4-benzoquinol methylase